MRILVAHNRYKYGGGEDAVAANEIAMLRANGHEVLSLTEDNADITGPLTTIKAAGSLFGSHKSYGGMCRLIDAFRPDVLHIHNWFPLLSPSIIEAANHRGVSVVQTLHNFRMVCANSILYRNGSTCQACLGKKLPLSGVVNGCYRDSRAASAVVTAGFAYHRALGTWKGISRFIALSGFQKELLIRGGIPKAQISVKSNFVPDTGSVGRGDGGYFLFVGRLTQEKGIHTAIRTWEEGTLPLPLWIIGDGPLRHEVAMHAERSSMLRYLGPRKPSEVAVAMAAARAVVFPSEWYEPFALTLIEAFSHGTPVLAADIGSTRELVRDQHTGLTFRVGCPDALGKNVLSLMHDEAAYRCMRRNCRAEYESTYTAAQNYPQLMAIYEQAIHERACRSEVQFSARTSSVPPIQGRPQTVTANILGVPVHALDLESALAAIHSAVQNRNRGYVSLAGAHGIIEARRDPQLRDIASRALLVLPDGMPVVWLARLQGHASMGRVFGPDLMLEIIGRQQFRNVTHFFWGGAQGVAARLREQMQQRFPDARIIGAESPPFHDLSAEEQTDFITRIRELKPDIIWVGVSTPKQDRLMARLSPLLDTTLMIGVGAAFLFHTGLIRDSPKWIKLAGLQWFHRLLQEPRRLWRRYLRCVPAFGFHALLQMSGLRSYPLHSSDVTDSNTKNAQPIRS